jgi:large subunit ribosomal protein L4
MALAAKLRDGQVVLIDELSLASPRTKDIAAILKALNLSGTSLLVGTAAYDPVIYRSARNIADVDVAPVGEFNALSVLRPDRLLLTKAALDEVRQRAASAREKKRSEPRDRRAKAAAAS